MSLRKYALIFGTGMSLAAFALPACKPYDLDGDYYLGPVDPQPFPIQLANCDCSTEPTAGALPNDNCIPPSDAAGDSVEPALSLCRPYSGKNYQPSSTNGSFAAVWAWVDGVKVGYYPFPVPDGSDPTVIETLTVKRAQAYVFDGDAANDTKSCTTPSTDYIFDQRRDFVRFDRQGSVFSEKQAAADGLGLPGERDRFGQPSYIPIYSEVAVTSNGEGCQTVKSAEGLVANAKLTLTTVPPPPFATTQHATGATTGKYLAWAVIDPGADVTFADGSLDPKTLLGPQRWGFYNHYLVAYIDGGYLPTEVTTDPDGNKFVSAHEQALYAPDNITDKDLNVVPGGPGIGLDVLEGVRGSAKYSPLCHVFSYFHDPSTPPATSVAEVMASAMQAPPMQNGLVDTKTYVYCLQTAAQ